MPHQQSFSYVGTGLPGLNLNSKLGLTCLAEGHNAVTPMRLEPAAPRSRVKHSTTELPRLLSESCHKEGQFSYKLFVKFHGKFFWGEPHDHVVSKSVL